MCWVFFFCLFGFSFGLVFLILLHKLREEQNESAEWKLILELFFWGVSVNIKHSHYYANNLLLFAQGWSRFFHKCIKLRSIGCVIGLKPKKKKEVFKQYQM